MTGKQQGWTTRIRRNAAWLASGAILGTSLWWAWESPLHTSLAEDSVAAIEARMAADMKYLASDELEGRGIGTAGLDKAADHIAAQFAALKLKTDLFEGSPFQKFEITAAVERGPEDRNRLEFTGPAATPGDPAQKIGLKLGTDFQTMGLGGSAQFTSPLVFVGYGITAKEHEYDDYAGIDVKNKFVILVRKEPQQNDPHSKFDGNRASQHATFNRKIANAFEHGAAGVILVNDQLEVTQKRAADEKNRAEALQKLVDAHRGFAEQKDPTPEATQEHRSEVNRLIAQLYSLNERLVGDYDQLPDFAGAGTDSSHPKFPVFFAKRSAIGSLLKAAGLDDLATIERQIDEDLRPRSKELANWTTNGEALVVRKMAPVKNVIGVLEGVGPLANETVIVGAHYDHVGRGGPGSGSLAVAPWTTDIHNGADDNASGTTSLLEVARRFAGQPNKPRRRLVFIAFTAEERGLLGSARYVREPRFPLEDTVAMVNMDMVGRLLDSKLIVYGTGTATQFDPLIESLNKKYQFTLTKHPEGFGPSDHSSFYARQIPVFHFFTGTHSDYHRPSDDADKINYEGMRRITDMVCEVVESIVNDEKRPEYKEVKSTQGAMRGGDRPYFGSIPDFGQEGQGYALMGVVKGGPAELAGLKAGDIIVKLGESRVGSLDDFDSALRKYKAGDKVPVTVKRGTEMVTVTVTLAPAR